MLDEIRGGVVCPHCLDELLVETTGAVCEGCEREFPRTDSGQLDLRLQDEKERTVSIEVGDYETLEGVDLSALRKQRDDPDVGDLPDRMSPELFSYLPGAGDDDERILDLGCGEDTLQTSVEAKGYSWVGIDISGEEAVLLADAHALPFRSDTFAGTISLKVLEHLEYPIVALSEVARVTRPGGRFLGNVAFVEPYHGNSVLHHSPTGILSRLDTAGLDVERIAPSGHGVLHTGVRMYPYLPRLLGYATLSGPYLLHRLWYAAGRRFVQSEKTTDEYRRTRFAQEFEFVAAVGE
jgi:SAM-dependent methyltransferase